MDLRISNTRCLSLFKKTMFKNSNSWNGWGIRYNIIYIIFGTDYVWNIQSLHVTAVIANDLLTI